MHDYTQKQHEALLTLFTQLPCMVMISGYDSPLYNEMLSGWQKVSFPAKTHTDVREECVWMNFSPPRVLHDARYLGSTFRERQAIKRRQIRMLDRIQRMNAIERNELITWLNNTYHMTTTGVAQCNVAL